MINELLLSFIVASTRVVCEMLFVPEQTSRTVSLRRRGERKRVQENLEEGSTWEGTWHNII